MKAGSKKTNAERLFYDMVETLRCNLLKEMIVLREEFGFGEERLMKFLDGVVERTDRFDDLLAEGMLDSKTAWERNKFADQIHRIVDTSAREILPKSVCDSMVCTGTRGESVAKFQRNERRRQGAVSISENVKAVEKMRRMQEFLREGNR